MECDTARERFVREVEAEINRRNALIAEHYEAIEREEAEVARFRGLLHDLKVSA